MAETETDMEKTEWWRKGEKQGRQKKRFIGNMFYYEPEFILNSP